MLRTFSFELGHIGEKSIKIIFLHYSFIEYVFNRQKTLRFTDRVIHYLKKFNLTVYINY